MSQGERRLAAIMFTDVVGYTTISQRDESTALQLLDEHRRLVRTFFAKHHGTEVKTTGDGFLVEFPSALEAVRCAFDVQQSLNELNVSKQPERRMLARVGIHLGDVVHSQNDVFGDAVNIASRIYPFAEAGGICVTSQVYDQIRNKFEFPLATLGKRQLKNVGEPTEVYRVILPWTNEVEETGPFVGNRVAVLPFTNMSPDPADEYFADGMTEEVISTMSRIEGVDVISRTSVMQYKKAPKPIRDVSRELEVGTILEGSVRKAGNKLRVTVQMIDAGLDRHVWAESYDRDMQDVFAIQSDIAQRVAGALQARISREYPKTPVRKEELDAYTTYMRAVQLRDEGTQQGLRTAVDLFRHAIELDPKFSRAWAGLAISICLLASHVQENFDSILEAEEAAKRAIELGPDEADAHAAMADVDGFQDRFDHAIIEARRAIELNPNLAEAYVGLAIQHAAKAELGEAISSLKKATMLDPLSFRIKSLLVEISMAAGKDEEALRMAKELLTLNPRNGASYMNLAAYHLQKVEFPQALEAITEAEKFDKDSPFIRLARGYVSASTGHRQEAEEALAELMRSEVESARLNASLIINIPLGNLDEAFKALMRMTETHSWPYLINVSPLFRPMRADPRYPEFLKRVGLSSMIGKV